MKTFTSYKRAEAPYFNLSEFLFLPVTPILIVAGISWPILYFLGFIPMVVANVIIALVANSILHGLKNASSNGRSHARRVSNSEVIASMLPSFLAILGVEFIVNAGVYLVVIYQKTGVFHTMYFYVWLFVVLGIPALYFLTQYLLYLRLLYFQVRAFRPLHLSVAHDPELLVYIEEVVFLNTKKRLIENVSVNDRRSISDIEKLKSMPLKERNEYLYSTAFSESIRIPKDTDKLKLSWYSVTEDTYYLGEIDFPFDKLPFIENEYPLNQSKLLRGERTKPLTLSIREAGTMSVYNRENTIIGPMVLKPVEVDEEKKKRLLGFTMYEWLQNRHAEKEDTQLVLNRIKHRIHLTSFLCNWQLTGCGLDVHTSEIDGVRIHEGFGNRVPPNTFMKRPLPVRMEFSYEHFIWASFYIDAEKLYELLQTTGTTEGDITFEIDLDAKKGDASLLVKCNDSQLPFTSFEKEIVPHCLEVVQEKLQEKEEINVKNELLKQVYEFIQQKDFSQAQQLCKTTLEQYPDFELMYFYEARLLWNTQGYEASYAKENYFVEKTRREPVALSLIYNHYGCLLDEEKRYKEALSYFEKAAAVQPSEVIYTANIAEIYYKQKNLKRALHYAEECVRKGYTSDIISEIMTLKG